MPSRSSAVLGAFSIVAVGCSSSGGTAPNVVATGSSSGSATSTGSAVGTGAAATGTPGGATGMSSGAGGTGTSGSTVGTAGTSSGTPGTGSGATSGSPGGGTGSTAGASSGAGGTTGMSSGAGGSSGAGAGASGATSGATGSGATSGATSGTNASSGRPSGPSMGCNMAPPATEPIGKSVLHMLDITGMAQEYVAGYTHRVYCTTMPTGYDPTKQYPVVFYGPGCGATACESSSFTGRTDIIYVQAISSADATIAAKTIVPANGSPGCFQTGRVSTVDSPELNYFDQVMDQVESKYCVDKGRIFAAGTSSGGWLSNYLGCARGNVIRGIAADSGGIPYARPMCTGGAAAMEFPGDSAMTTDPAGNQIGLAVARDLFIKTNGCNTTPTTMSFGTAMGCQFYGGCSSPVVWCNTGGAHQAGNNYLSPAGWAFWSTLQ